MSNTIKIDKHIPIPQDTARRKYDFRSMQKGDSFLLDHPKHRYAIFSALKYYNDRNNTNIKITTKKEGNTVRVWIK
jgi:hypothetical protein